MRASRQRPLLTSLLMGVALLPISAHAADLREGIEQLAGQVGQAAPEGRQLRVAITDFPDLQRVTSDLSRYIAERLTTRLVQNPRFSVLERRRLGQVLGELKFGLSDLADPNKVKQLGRMVGVEALVFGSISDLGNVVDIDARLIEVETSRLVHSASVSILKDRVVAQLLSEGRELASGAAASMGEAAPGLSGPSVASVPRRSGVHPVGQSFSLGEAHARLLNIEVVEGRLLRFNFTFEWSISFAPTAPVEVFLDSPNDTTFLVDQLGRQHPLVQAAGIGSEQPMRLTSMSSKRFSLIFPLGAEM